MQIALRATFGGSPNPKEWSIISESVCDLANAIMNDPDWDTNILHSPLQNRVPPDTLLPDNIPIAQALPTIVSPPLSMFAKNDIYIDDNVTVALDTACCRYRARAGVLLAIHTAGRTPQEIEPLTRTHLASIAKLTAEGRLEELKTTLGWDINTRSLTVSLPSHKYIQ